MSDWRTVSVAQLESEGALLVQDGNHGNDRPRPDEFVADGVPFIRAADMDDGRVLFEQASHINSAAERRIRKGRGRGGDTLLSHKGTVGKVAFVPNESLSFVCSPQTTFWRSTNTSVIYPRYIPYLLRSPELVSQLDTMKSATDMAPYVSLTQQRQLQLTFPPVEDQQAIAEVLGALDDKIAANAALAKAADELMHQTLLSTAVGQTLALSAIADFVNGKAFTKDASGTGRAVVRIAELNSGLSGSTVYSDAIVEDKHVARAGDILFAWSGSLTLHRWFRGEAIVNQHIFKVIPKPGIPMWLAYELVRQKLDHFKGIAADKATTMGHIQRHHLDEPVTMPSKSAIAQMDNYMEALWSTSLNAERESQTLAATRDVLLPQLMSGKLRVRDAKQIATAEGAV